MAGGNDKTRNGKGHRNYRRMASQLKRRTARESLPCWVCGNKIDTTLPTKDAKSFTADHVIALKDGGDLLGELRPAHRGCNSTRNAKVLDKKPTATYR